MPKILRGGGVSRLYKKNKATAHVARLPRLASPPQPLEFSQLTSAQRSRQEDTARARLAR
jgi:hypothetical protein